MHTAPASQRRLSCSENRQWPATPCVSTAVVRGVRSRSKQLALSHCCSAQARGKPHPGGVQGRRKQREGCMFINLTGKRLCSNPVSSSKRWSASKAHKYACCPILSLLSSILIEERGKCVGLQKYRAGISKTVACQPTLWVMLAHTGANLAGAAAYQP
eukprot:1158250-Pelagomonas_calceolata.AAC.5